MKAAVRVLTLLAAVLCTPVSLFAQAGEYDTRVRGYWVDPSTGLLWAGRDNFGRDLNWRDATEYCRDLQLAGYADWRLPEIHELEGIYDRAADALGLAGTRNERRQTFHVKGDLVLTGHSWSGSGFIDARKRFVGWGLYFDFVNGRRNETRLGFRANRALCVRGDVTVDLSLPARYTGVDMTARNIDYLKARMGCEIAVFTRTPWRGAERACRRLVDLADHLEGDPVLERVNALGLHAVSLVSAERLTESLTLLDRALATRRQRYEDDADAADLQVIAAQLQIAMGNAAAAAALFESAIATYEKDIARPSSLQEKPRQRLAAIRKRFAELTLATGRPGEAAVLPPPRRVGNTDLMGPIGPLLTDDDLRQLAALLPGGRGVRLIVGNDERFGSERRLDVDIFDGAGQWSRDFSQGRMIRAETTLAAGAGLETKKSWKALFECPYIQIPMGDRDALGVLVSGEAASRLRSNDDRNRPTIILPSVVGPTPDTDEIVSAITFVRALAGTRRTAFAADADPVAYTDVQAWPIESLSRGSNNTIEMRLVHDTATDRRAQRIVIGRDGTGWTIVEMRPW
jgi:tetratricopeptide (TPR) repeat protein